MLYEVITQKEKKNLIFDTRPEQTGGAPEFVSDVKIDEESVAHGVGLSKKEAEQNAAKEALDALDI